MSALLKRLWCRVFGHSDVIHWFWCPAMMGDDRHYPHCSRCRAQLWRKEL